MHFPFNQYDLGNGGMAPSFLYDGHHLQMIKHFEFKVWSLGARGSVLMMCVYVSICMFLFCKIQDFYTKKNLNKKRRVTNLATVWENV